MSTLLVNVDVPDLQRGIDFYTRAFGLRIARRFDRAVELLGVNTLARRGLSSRNLKVGDRLIVTGFGARDGTNTANASTVTRADTGESLWVSGPGDRN